VPRASCRVCGSPLPKRAVFCPQCGSRVDEDATETAVIPPPPIETGPVPVETASVEPHLFGVTPPMAVLALAVAALAAGAALAALSHYLVGAAVLAAALLLGLSFVATSARRRPGGASGRARARALAAATAVSERAAARRELGRLLREREQLRGTRAKLVLALGEAVYEQDEQATQSVRAELEELDMAAADKEAEMEAVAERARERLEQARLEVQPTEMVEIPGDPGTQPPTIPEPTPVPSPQPGPVPVPEPTPVPSPQPGPMPVPEPTPAPSPEPGPLPVPEPGPVPSPQPGPPPELEQTASEDEAPKP
jgi:hypothetical protein